MSWRDEDEFEIHLPKWREDFCDGLQEKEIGRIGTKMNPRFATQETGVGDGIS